MLEDNQDKSSNKSKSNEAYRTIGEVAKITDIPQHVIRFWESKFSNIAPQKIKGRRYYLQKDIEQIQIIKDLLYKDGLTIKGVSQALNSNNNIKKNTPQNTNICQAKNNNSSDNIKELKEILSLLQSCKQTIKEIL